MATTAIIPAYNESARIGAVLEAMTSAKHVSEVVVVDDGSEDGLELEKTVANFSGFRYIRNPENRGKGYCMELGAKESSSDILLFCDADLTGLAGWMLDSVVRPVKEGACDMYIGIFQTPGRQFYDQLLKATGFPSGINSGLRAMHREVWDSLPKYYKRSYYIESGLNYLVRWKFRGPLYALLPYTQAVKEEKYGLLWGSYLRWKMNLEVALSFLRVHLYERFFGFGKKA